MKKLLKSYHRKLNHALLLIIVPLQCHAGSNRLLGVLSKAETLLTSTLIRTLGAIAIGIVGYMWMWQNRISKSVAISVIAGIGIVLGAPDIFDLLAGS